ncbi:hypothetical protein T492DRAFT_849332 [Pavlovales sp. CCMP2436]|nr:hypothetical protein T492DRAFT_849332 [Pavlovales sp. CCMP2436]
MSVCHQAAAAHAVAQAQVQAQALAVQAARDQAAAALAAAEVQARHITPVTALCVKPVSALFHTRIYLFHIATGCCCTCRCTPGTALFRPVCLISHPSLPYIIRDQAAAAQAQAQVARDQAAAAAAVQAGEIARLNEEQRRIALKHEADVHELRKQMAYL